jgi:hypothetical protein
MAQQPYVYRRRDPEHLHRRATQTGSEFSGFILDEFKVYQPKKGENYVRILPPTWEGATHYAYDVWAHYRIGPGNGTALLCINQMRGQRCPICEAAMGLTRSGDDEEAKQLATRRRALVWMIDRRNEREGPQLWAMPWTLDREIAKQSQDRQTGEFFIIDEPDEGYDISFDREGEGVQVKYAGVALARRPTSVDRDILQYINECPVPSTLLWRDYNEIQTIYSGGADGEQDQRPSRDDDRRAPPPRQAQERDRQPPQRTSGGWTPPARRSAPPPSQEPDQGDQGYDPNYDPGYDPGYDQSYDAGDPGYDPNYDDRPPPEQDSYSARPQNDRRPPVQQNYERRQPPPPQRQAMPNRQAPPPQRQAPPPQRQAPPAGNSGPPPSGAQRAQSLRDRYGRH